MYIYIYIYIYIYTYVYIHIYALLDDCAPASVSCTGSCSSVKPIILGSLDTRDPVVLPLVPRLTRLLVGLAQATASRPDLILCSSPGGFRPCQTLARAATDSRASLESFLPLEFSPASLTDLQVFVYHGSHCVDDGRAGVGACLFLVVASQIHEVYRYQSFLGHMCTSPVAEFQGAYLALLLALSFSTWRITHGLQPYHRTCSCCPTCVQNITR